MAEPAPACTERHAALASWLVAQIAPDDEAALLRHLAGCETCRAEADSLLAVSAVTLGADPLRVPWRPAVDEPPPADLPERILARVASERRAHRARWMVLAAVLIVVAGVVGAIALRSGDAPLDGEPVVFAQQAAGVEAEAVVAPDAGGSLVELRASGLDPDVTYALWLTPPGGGYRERVAAGTFRPSPDGDVDVRLRSALPAEAMGRVWATTPDGDVALDTERA